MQITIPVTKHTTELTTIELPFFSKVDGIPDYYAILSPVDAINIFLMPNFSLIKIHHDEASNYFEEAAKHPQITESEFFAAYDKAREATDLYPKLIAKTN